MAFSEFVGEIAWKMASEFQSGTKTQPWKLVPAQRLIAIWKASAKQGFVRDSKGLAEIAERMVENTARLLVNTELAGHGEQSTQAVLFNYGLDDEISGEQIEQFVDWAVDMPTGGWRISDYGLESLIGLASQLMDDPTDEEKLVIIDRMLNVTHQRSDLASWFVEGGSATLDRLKLN